MTLSNFVKNIVQILTVLRSLICKGLLILGHGVIAICIIQCTIFVDLYVCDRIISCQQKVSAWQTCLVGRQSTRHITSWQLRVLNVDLLVLCLVILLFITTLWVL